MGMICDVHLMVAIRTMQATPMANQSKGREGGVNFIGGGKGSDNNNTFDPATSAF